MNNDIDDLKEDGAEPCPFCGEKAYVRHAPKNCGVNAMYVECTNIKCSAYDPDNWDNCEIDQRNMVYVVIENNGEEWEDNYEYIKAVFSSYEKAVEYIEVDCDYSRCKECYYHGGCWEPNFDDDDWIGTPFMRIEEYEIDNPKYTAIIEES